MLCTAIERNVHTRQSVQATVWSRRDKFIYSQKILNWELFNLSQHKAMISFVPLLSVPLLSVPLLSVPLLSVPLLSVPLLSVPLLSVPLLSVPLLSVPLLSVPLLSVPLLFWKTDDLIIEYCQKYLLGCFYKSIISLKIFQETNNNFPTPRFLLLQYIIKTELKECDSLDRGRG